MRKRRKKCPPPSLPDRGTGNVQQCHKYNTFRAGGNDGFPCAFCGDWRPWAQLAGFDRRLLFCPRCVFALEALTYGDGDALAILRRAGQ